MVRDKMPIEGTVVITDKQTSGKGQRLNSWLSEPKSNLICSYILHPAFLAAKNQFSLSAAVALSVSDVVAELLVDQTVQIKWPNDVLVNGKKVAGILIENMLRGSNIDCSIVGIGLNVNQTKFQDLPNATSLKLVSGVDYDIQEVLPELNAQLEKRYLQLREGKQHESLQLLNDRLWAVGTQRTLTINGINESVTVIGIRPSGELELKHADCSLTLHQHHEIGWNL